SRVAPDTARLHTCRVSRWAWPRATPEPGDMRAGRPAGARQRLRQPWVLLAPWHQRMWAVGRARPPTGRGGYAVGAQLRGVWSSPSRTVPVSGERFWI